VTPRLKLIAWLLIAGAAIAAPAYIDKLGILSATRIVILALWAVSLNLLLGRTGLVSFAHAAFFGVGAYTVALLWLHLDLPAVLGVPLSVTVGALVAFLTGAVALRAVHLYFSMLTLALSQLLFVIAFVWYDFTQGDNGIHGIDIPDVLRDTAGSYWFVLAVGALGILALWLVSRSPFGTALQAIRENRQRAAFIGINVRRYELAAFTVAGAFAALAGSLFALFNRSAYPGLMDWTAGAQPIFVILIGGMYEFVGPVLGAMVYVLLEESVTRQTLYSNLVLGAVFLGIVLLRPDGLAGLVRTLAGRMRRSRLAPVADDSLEPHDTDQLEPER